MASLKPTYVGYVSTTEDADRMFHEVHSGEKAGFQRRLSKEELVESGHIFIYDEEVAGIQRWTDHLIWSPSRVLNGFLIYLQTGTKHKRSKTNKLDSVKHGLVKKTISTMLDGKRYHLISYYKVKDVVSEKWAPSTPMHINSLVPASPASPAFSSQLLGLGRLTGGHTSPGTMNCFQHQKYVQWHTSEQEEAAEGYKEACARHTPEMPEIPTICFVKALLSGLRFMYRGHYRRSSGGATPQMNDLASRGTVDWERAYKLAEKDFFWDGAVQYFKAHVVFSGTYKLTRHDLKSEFYTFFEMISKPGSSSRNPVQSAHFSWHQRLLIICFGLGIVEALPEFPENWRSWERDELDELVGLVSTSPLSESNEGIDSGSVERLLLELEGIFSDIGDSALYPYFL
ncbi:MAG: hypothetical protein M1839_004951 [Geoglossum umbratile]|nr:MAG: hypothetical protein M1839_004951 [Geoglossum umbratile]